MPSGADRLGSETAYSIEDEVAWILRFEIMQVRDDESNLSFPLLRCQMHDEGSGGRNTLSLLSSSDASFSARLAATYAC